MCLDIIFLHKPLFYTFFFPPKLTRLSNQKICPSPASLVQMSFISMSYRDAWSGKMNLGRINRSSLSLSVYTCSMFSWHFLLSSSTPGYKRLHFAWTSVTSSYHTVGKEALWGLCWFIFSLAIAKQTFRRFAPSEMSQKYRSVKHLAFGNPILTKVRTR